MSNEVYDSPGKCRKKCLCGKYIHARSAFCRLCGHEFILGSKKKVEEAKLPKPVETYSEGGKGKKKCPKCTDIWVGVRAQFCKCGFDFSTMEKKVPIHEQIDTELREYAAAVGAPNDRVIVAPTGKYNKVPKEITKSGILSWIHENLFVDNNGVMFVSALRYRLRQIYGYGSPEYNQSSNFLTEWYKSL